MTQKTDLRERSLELMHRSIRWGIAGFVIIVGTMAYSCVQRTPLRIKEAEIEAQEESQKLEAEFERERVKMEAYHTCVVYHPTAHCREILFSAEEMSEERKRIKSLADMCMSKGNFSQCSQHVEKLANVL